MTALGNPTIRILIVDDHPILREGLAAILALEADIDVVGQAENGAEALQRYGALKPDIVLMDMRMPMVGGIDATAAIRRLAPAARIIILTTYSGDAEALRALKAGAAGYLLKSALRKELVEVIRTVHAGRRYVPQDIASQIAIHTGDIALSRREANILERVAAGSTNKVIAQELGLSEETIKAHMKTIFGKLDVSDRTRAVTIAIQRGIISV